MTDTEVVSLERAGCRFEGPRGSVDALVDTSMTVRAGQSVAILGRSGSGKSTLVSLLALLRRPSSGIVRVGGVDVAALSPAQLAAFRSRNVGVAFQSFHLEPALSAAENVLLPWVFSSDRMSRRAATARAAEVLDALGVSHLARRRPFEMSGGQRQRIALARALFADPPLLLADEPTGNLDEETAGEVADLMFGLSRRLGTAVVVVTHDRAVAELAGRSLTLVRGMLSEDHARVGAT